MNRCERDLGLIVGSREFFPDELSIEGGDKVVEVLEEQGFTVKTPFSAEEGNLAETREDSKKYADYFEEEERIEGIIVTLPNFGDEKAITETFKISDLDVPILVHAFPDELGKMDRSHRRDSFCGKISVCNNLNQAKIPFTNTQLHVEDPESKEFKEDLEKFNGICRIVSGLKDARLGVIGVRPNPFQTVRFSEKILEKEGISVETAGLIDIVNEAKDLDEDDPKVKNVLKEIETKFSTENIPEKYVIKTAKLNVVLTDWLEKNNLDTISLQCWPSIEEYYDLAPCGAMSLLSQDLRPAACESDVMGSLSMYALQLASGKPAALVDMNNNYGENRDKFLAFHCSNFPSSFFEGEECELGYHEMQENYGSCSGKIASGPATFFRVSTDDKNGNMRAFVAEGEFTEDEVETFGGYGVAKVENLQSLMDTIVTEGFEHHAAVVRDHVADELEESLEKYLDWEIIRHTP